jgi:limonene-1,2-epoxide hydrolase
MTVGGQVDVDIIHIDHLTRADGTTASLPMMGVIEVHDGLIAAWRDSFDLGQFTSQVFGGS